MIGATRFGRSSRKMILRFDAPSDREASMNSFSRNDSTWPRMIRPMYGHDTSAITRISTGSPGVTSPPRQPFPSEHADASPIASSRTGNARRTSIVRESTVSIHPRKKPATIPMTTPKSTAMPVAMNATSRDTRAP